MTGHKPFSELTRDFSPERKAKIADQTNQLREEMTLQELNNQIEEVEELESSPCTGREISDEDALQVFDYYLSGRYLIRNLEIVRQRKQKTLEELAHLEAAEKRILDRIREQKIHLKSDQHHD